MTNKDRIIKYLSDLMDENERKQFLNDLKRSDELKNDLDEIKNSISSLKIETENIVDTNYFSTVIPRAKSKMESRSKYTLVRQISYALSLAALFAVMFLIYQPGEKNQEYTFLSLSDFEDYIFEDTDSASIEYMLSYLGDDEFDAAQYGFSFANSESLMNEEIKENEIVDEIVPASLYTDGYTADYTDEDVNFIYENLIDKKIL
ncbi:MAG: hypothetical protein K9J16_12165 [Melioribacteraceae bacterium]|nr:hypothetical protein [Melioribacteraceae bacterium]MCF8354584.1 hypothetical protein [Melioribacteraceae bacterium]MCF8394936.1 hypothetical protein [Melioribacteraceae bacterium]MCF8420161.1 hypothetical protein [Melioribacteraceae bacterium]